MKASCFSLRGNPSQFTDASCFPHWSVGCLAPSHWAPTPSRPLPPIWLPNICWLSDLNQRHFTSQLKYKLLFVLILTHTTYFLWPTTNDIYSIHLYWKKFFFYWKALCQWLTHQLRCKHFPRSPSATKQTFLQGDVFILQLIRGRNPCPVGQNFSFHHCRHVKTPKPQAMISVSALSTYKTDGFKIGIMQSYVK